MQMNTTSKQTIVIYYRNNDFSFSFAIAIGHRSITFLWEFRMGKMNFHRYPASKTRSDETFVRSQNLIEAKKK